MAKIKFMVARLREDRIYQTSEQIIAACTCEGSWQATAANTESGQHGDPANELAWPRPWPRQSDAWEKCFYWDSPLRNASASARLERCPNARLVGFVHSGRKSQWQDRCLSLDMELGASRSFQPQSAAGRDTERAGKRNLQQRMSVSPHSCATCSTTRPTRKCCQLTRLRRKHLLPPPCLCAGLMDLRK